MKMAEEKTIQLIDKACSIYKSIHAREAWLEQRGVKCSELDYRNPGGQHWIETCQEKETQNY